MYKPFLLIIGFALMTSACEIIETKAVPEETQSSSLSSVSSSLGFEPHNPEVWKFIKEWSAELKWDKVAEGSMSTKIFKELDPTFSLSGIGAEYSYAQLSEQEFQKYFVESMGILDEKAKRNDWERTTLLDFYESSELEVRYSKYSDGKLQFLSIYVDPTNCTGQNVEHPTCKKWISKVHVSWPVPVSEDGNLTLMEFRP